MNQGMRGLFAGLGNAMAETGQQGVQDYYQKSRLKLRERLNSKAAKEDRQFKKELSQTEYERQKELAQMENEQAKERDQAQFERQKELAQAEAPNEAPWQVEYQLDRVKNEVDHLWKMRRAVEDTNSGEVAGLARALGAEGGSVEVTDNNRSNLLEEIDRRIRENEQQMNRLLGNVRPVDPIQRFVDKASEIPEADREEYLNDVRGHPRVTEDAIQQIQAQWGRTDDSGAKQPQSQPEQQQGKDEAQQGQGKDQPSDQTSGILMEILKGSNQTQVPLRQGEKVEPDSKPQQANEEEQPSQSESKPEDSAGTQDNRLGPAIERGLSWVGGLPDRLQQVRRQGAIRSLEEIANKGGPETQQERNQFLNQHVQYINDVSPEVQRRLIQIFGEDAIRPYLNQE